MNKSSTGNVKRTRKAHPQASMHDVARHAGVSLITVSRFLRTPGKVSERTRQLVEDAIAELGYVPNLVAGGLASSQSTIVSMIVPFVSHGVFAEAIQGVSDVVDAHGYNVLLGHSTGSVEREEAILRSILGYRPAGVVIQGANHSERTVEFLRKAAMPVVEIGTLPETPIGMAVGYSNHQAALAMTRHLIARGYRRIGFVGTDPATNDRILQRLAGYRQGLDEAGIAFDPALVLRSPFGIVEGRQLLHVYRSMQPMPDAVFCASDLWAAGMISECRKQGIGVPTDLAIAGFNDQDIASVIDPAITTIRVPRYEIGRQAGRMIVETIAGRSVERMVDVGFELVVRDST
ncbi:LacI family DNA-binding transcriptional regulator [Jiella avicenniae]|nr:LacI family DNA-binding transcriptional regulator [Jiella avicenniae]